MSKANDTIRLLVYMMTHCICTKNRKKKNVKKPILKNVDFLKLFNYYVLVSMHSRSQDYTPTFLNTKYTFFPFLEYCVYEGFLPFYFDI